MQVTLRLYDHHQGCRCSILCSMIGRRNVVTLLYFISADYVFIAIAVVFETHCLHNNDIHLHITCIMLGLTHQCQVALYTER